MYFIVFFTDEAYNEVPAQHVRDMTQGPYIVTGASKGIGRAIALELAKQGHPVVALARASTELEQVGAELTLLHPNSIAFACDLSNSDSIAATATELNRLFPWIAGLIHNAGTIEPIQPLNQVPIHLWSASIQVNLIGVQDLTQRLMKQYGWYSPDQNYHYFKRSFIEPRPILVCILCWQSWFGYVGSMYCPRRCRTQHQCDFYCSRHCRYRYASHHSFSQTRTLPPTF